MRIKRVFGVEKGRERPPVRFDHEADNFGERKQSTACLDKNLENINCGTSPDESIPIPGVTEVSSYWDEHGQDTDRFSRPDVYIKQVMDEVSYALTRRTANYDMGDEDEEWLIKFNRVGNKGFGSSFENLSDETFELIIDAFEKAFFCCPDEFHKHNAKSQVPIGCLCSGLCSEDAAAAAAAALYRYWLKKRKLKKSALVRVFEAHRVKKRRGRRKNWKRMECEGRTASKIVKPVAGEDEVVEEEYDETKLAAAEESARKLGDLAVKKRNEAQLITKRADFLMLKAIMALRIAEEAQIRESLDLKFSY